MSWSLLVFPQQVGNGNIERPRYCPQRRERGVPSLALLQAGDHRRGEAGVARQLLLRDIARLAQRLDPPRERPGVLLHGLHNSSSYAYFMVVGVLVLSMPER